MSAGNLEFTADFFTESSRAWMENKKRNGASMVYLCEHIYSTKRQCNRASIMKDPLSCRRCNQHKQTYIKI
jgi:hypothetical protein